MTRATSNETNWRGLQKHYYTVSNIRVLIYFAYIGVVVAEGIYLRRWIGRENTSATTQPYNFWVRNGIYILADAVVSLISSFFIWRQKWSPGLALMTSIVLFGVWVAGASVNALSVYSNEYFFVESDKWEKFGYAEVGLQAVLAVCYLVMVGFAAKGVVAMRRAKRQGDQYKMAQPNVV